MREQIRFIPPALQHGNRRDGPAVRNPKRKPSNAIKHYASRHLRRDRIEHLIEKFPRSNYPSTEEWAEAVITEIRTRLMPAIISLKLEPGEKIDALSDLARKVAVEMRLTLSFIHAREFFEHELDQLERLDARIVRLVKDLVQMKTMKQILRQTSIERADEQPRKIAAPGNSKNSPRPIDPEKNPSLIRRRVEPDC